MLSSSIRNRNNAINSNDNYSVAEQGNLQKQKNENERQLIEIQIDIESSRTTFFRILFRLFCAFEILQFFSLYLNLDCFFYVSTWNLAY